MVVDTFIADKVPGVFRGPEEDAISTPPPVPGTPPPPPALRFGVNYTPRRGWFHAWHDFDPRFAREDLAQIAGLGLDHVRVFHL